MSKRPRKKRINSNSNKSKALRMRRYLGKHGFRVKGRKRKPSPQAKGGPVEILEMTPERRALLENTLETRPT